MMPKLFPIFPFIRKLNVTCMDSQLVHILINLYMKSMLSASSSPEYWPLHPHLYYQTLRRTSLNYLD
jgi:hypothetical protein